MVKNKTIEQYREMNSVLLKENRELKTLVQAQKKIIENLSKENCIMKRDLLGLKREKND